ncbi:hypothetical protein GGX14DRAFT_665834 [Mycena pura]|uniref:SAM domain-containing protein n=1 Tax=Mycena pura TaxID=153505 RepID=A0AAD6YA00_9AGAR|nr:hypothetical protein GGX14DRAFT_665834 [Mycena pura]
MDNVPFPHHNHQPPPPGNHWQQRQEYERWVMEQQLNGQRTVIGGSGAYLLGLTDQLPPLTNPQLAAVQLHHALNSSAFDGTHQPHAVFGNTGGSTNTVSGPGPATAVKLPQSFETVITKPGVNGALPVKVRLSLFRDIEPADFLSRVRANQDVDDTVALLWKPSNAKKSDPAKPFSTAADAAAAIKFVIDLNDNARRTDKLTVNIIDPRPSQKPEKLAKEPKETELAYREELAIVKQKLACDDCTTGYCFRRRAPNGDHIGPHKAIDMGGMTLWARMMKNNPTAVPRDCTIPPNNIKFDELLNNDPSLRRQCSSCPQPDIHIHLPHGSLGPTYTTHNATDAEPLLGKRKHDEPADNEEADEIIIPVDDLLAELDKKMPSSNFLQYQSKLVNEGIIYCHQLAGFDKADLIGLGIKRGVVADLLNGTSKMLRMAKKRRVEADKENSTVST